ncbi:hypothetical protein RJ639_044378 [Escallonia herrerae]|uniref:Uncharacterized protein n=1 Tax=Escallonia herrerae TaxID=1293975 RepID=A0AA89AZK8_9ASTE|nr:hypothetical protein RJ639_044378 [Escallonia herrerae]
MISAPTLQALNPAAISTSDQDFAGIYTSRCRLNLRPHNRRFATLSLQPNTASSESSVSSHFTSTVGTSCPPLQLSDWNLTQRHILVLNFIACAAAVSATWLFFSAIPTLLAFRKAAESLEKLLDVTREELPGTMAAVRLSGMEISDLTMELSDLGQEITQGVRSSTRAVRLAEERLRRLTNMAPSASTQEVILMETKIAKPALARSARGIKEGIVRGRAVVQMFFSLTRFSKMFLNYFKARAKV